MLDEKLLERVLDRLGLSAPPSPDIDGLRTIYAAWCVSVPFDNVAKLIALRSGSASVLPGLDAAEFFHRWLDHGAAGTCWPTSKALFEVLYALGFDARRVAGSMGDTGIVSHASVKVSVGGADWLVDTSMLTRTPLPLTDEIHIPDDKLFGAEVEPTEGTHIVWADLPPNPTLIPCRLLVDPATPEFYTERYEASRMRSGFNQRLYAMRNRSGERLVLNANVRISKTPAGIETQALNASQLCEALRNEMGISGALIEAWRSSGALEASFEPPSGPPSAAITMKPPSQRICD
jgi:N-hydroxyarylamine O-acetyltransferase